MHHSIAGFQHDRMTLREPDCSPRIKHRQEDISHPLYTMHAAPAVNVQPTSPEIDHLCISPMRFTCSMIFSGVRRVPGLGGREGSAELIF